MMMSRGFGKREVDVSIQAPTTGNDGDSGGRMRAAKDDTPLRGRMACGGDRPSSPRLASLGLPAAPDGSAELNPLAQGFVSCTPALGTSTCNHRQDYFPAPNYNFPFW